MNYNNLMITFIFIFIFIFFVVKSPRAAFSREELVQLAGYGEEKLSTVLISGSLLCQPCLSAQTQLLEFPIRGALVGVHCQAKGSKSKSSCSEAVTDEYGDFLIDLPSYLHATPKLENICSVKVLQLPKESPCQSAYDDMKHNGLKLASVGNSIRTYTAGSLKLQHLTSKTSTACIKQMRSGN